MCTLSVSCRIIRLSSPNLNVVFIVGIILVYLMVVLFGIDSNLVSTEGVSGLCQTRLWLGVIAFTLVYGSILAQTFRVFYILRNIKVAQNKDKIRVYSVARAHCHTYAWGVTVTTGFCQLHFSDHSGMAPFPSDWRISSHWHSVSAACHCCPIGHLEGCTSRATLQCECIKL